MSYTKPQRAVIDTPATATEELHNNVVSAMILKYSKVLTPELMIAHRKGAYALVINTTINNQSLELTLGTVNAKVATEQCLTAITSKFSSITLK